jgi:hypothetical protein
MQFGLANFFIMSTYNFLNSSNPIRNPEQELALSWKGKMNNF